MSYLDETGLAYFWDKIKQTFWSLLSRSSDVSVYISKTGSDSNSGLSSSAPVATFARAIEIAQNYSTSGTLAFYVGAGEWGDVDIDGSLFRCSAFKIANFTDSAPLTVSAFNSLSGASAPPHFSTLILRECTVSLGAIYAADIEFFQTYNLDSNIFFSFSRIVLHESYLALTNAIVNSSTSATNNIILTITSRLNIFGGTIHFDNVTRDYFVSNDSASTIRIASDVTFSGTFTGAKYQFTSFTEIQNNSINPDNFPGTEAGYGGYYYHGTHRTRWNGAGTFNWIDANTFSVADSSRPENGVFRPVAVVDSGGVNAGCVEVGFQTTGGRYVCFQARNRTNTGWLDGYRVTEAADGTITHTVGSSPAANADNKEIATTEWVIDKIASDSGVVHTTGAESISGVKTFSNYSVWATNSPALAFRHMGLNGIVNAPSVTVPWVLNFNDKNDTLFGRLRYEFLSSGARNAFFGLVNGSGTYSQLIVGYDADGVAFAKAPQTSTTRTDNADIITRGFLAGSSSNVVHRTGAETIDGAKTFTDLLIDSTNASIPFIRRVNDTGYLWLTGNSSYGSSSLGGQIFLYGYNRSAYAGGVVLMAHADSAKDPETLAITEYGMMSWTGRNFRISTDPDVSNVGEMSCAHRGLVDDSDNSAEMTFLTGVRNSDNNRVITATYYYVEASKAAVCASFRVYDWFHLNAAYKSVGLRCLKAWNDFSFQPFSDNDIKLGAGTTRRWKVIYCGSATINTSDEKEKSGVLPFPDELLDAWAEVEFRQFQFNDAVAEKGQDSARLHSGAVAQQIHEAMSRHGIDPFRWALLCRDQADASDWDEDVEIEPAQYAEDGSVVRPAKVETLHRHEDAVDRWGLRYEEALCVEAAYQRRENARLKKRVADLEDRLAALELRLGSE